MECFWNYDINDEREQQWDKRPPHRGHVSKKSDKRGAEARR